MGLFSWVGLFLGDYSIIMFSAPVGSHCLHFFWCLCSLTSWPLVRIPTYRTPFLHIMLVVLCAFSPHAVLLLVIENTQMWFCSSVDFIDSVLNPSPFCTLSGIQLLCWFCHPVHTCRELINRSMYVCVCMCMCVCVCSTCAFACMQAWTCMYVCVCSMCACACVCSMCACACM